MFPLTGSWVLAQAPELFALQYNYLPQVSAIETADTASVGFSEIAISFLVPIQPNEKWAILLGAGYGLVQPRSELSELNTELHFIALQCTTAFEINQRSHIIGVVLPAISSTLQDPLSFDDFLTQASLSYVRKVNDAFLYGFGALFTSRFGFPQLFPLLMLQYKTQKVQFQLNMPTLAQATWNYDKRLSYGIKIAVNGSQFNAARDAAYNQIPVDAFNFSRILIGPEVSIGLKNNLFLDFFGGLAVRRILELNSDSGNLSDLGLQNGLFFSTKFYLKLPQPAKTEKS